MDEHKAKAKMRNMLTVKLKHLSAVQAALAQRGNTESFKGEISLVKNLLLELETL